MTDMPDSVRIMCVPWTIRYVDIVGSDPDDGSDVDFPSATIYVCERETPERLKWHLFWSVLAAIQAQCLRGELLPTGEQNAALHNGLWAALRDNWPVVRQWFGFGSGSPCVIEGETLRVSGFTYKVVRPLRCDGAGTDTLGQVLPRRLTLEVQAQLPVHVAAETALHELLHLSLGDVCNDLYQNETFVSLFASLLAQVFFDNEEVISAIFGGE